MERNATCTLSISSPISQVDLALTPLDTAPSEATE